MKAPVDPTQTSVHFDRGRRLEREMFDELGTDTELLRFLLDTSADALWCWDLEEPGDIWFSSGFWTLLGYGGAPPRFSSGGVDSLLDPADLKTALANMELHCSSPNVPYDQVLRYKHRDGSTVWLRSRGHVLRGADGSPTRMIGVHQDLTEVIRNERRTHSLLDSFPGVLLVIDEDGVFEDIHTNAPWLALAPPEEHFGRHVSEIVEPSLAALVADVTARSLETGRTIVVDYYLTPQDGTRRRYEARVRPMRGRSASEKRAVVWHVYDISERYEAQRELERKNDELRQFAHVAAHDLRSPLQGIQQLTGFLLEDLDVETVGAESMGHVRMIGERVLRMQRLLDGLLEYAQAPGRVAYRWVEFEDVLDAALGLLPPVREGLRIDAVGPFPRLWTDATLLQLILQNLVANAIEHHDGEEGWVRIEARERLDGVEIRVVDDGPGVPEEDRDRAFRMFTTLGAGAERKGVGLAIVRKSVQALGGEVRIEATEGGGATFVVRLPEVPHGPRDRDEEP